MVSFGKMRWFVKFDVFYFCLDLEKKMVCFAKEIFAGIISFRVLFNRESMFWG